MKAEIIYTGQKITITDTHPTSCYGIPVALIDVITDIPVAWETPEHECPSPLGSVAISPPELAEAAGGRGIRRGADEKLLKGDELEARARELGVDIEGELR